MFQNDLTIYKRLIIKAGLSKDYLKWEMVERFLLIGISNTIIMSQLYLIVINSDSKKVKLMSHPIQVGTCLNWLILGSLHLNKSILSAHIQWYFLLCTVIYTLRINYVFFPFVGEKHITFWKLEETFTGLKLHRREGIFGKCEITDIEGALQLPDGKVC